MTTFRKRGNQLVRVKRKSKNPHEEGTREHTRHKLVETARAALPSTRKKKESPVKPAKKRIAKAPKRVKQSKL